MVFPICSADKPPSITLNPYMVSTGGVEIHMVSNVFSTLVVMPRGGTTLAIQDLLGIEHLTRYLT